MSVKDQFWVTGLSGLHKHSHIYSVLPLNCNNVATYQLTTPNLSVTWPLACRVIPAPSFFCTYWHSLRVTGGGFWKPSGGALHRLWLHCPLRPELRWHHLIGASLRDCWMSPLIFIVMTQSQNDSLNLFFVVFFCNYTNLNWLTWEFSINLVLSLPTCMERYHAEQYLCL